MPVYAFKNNTPRLDPSVYIAPTAQVIGNVRMDENSSAWFGTVLRGDTSTISIGKNTNIQDLSMCHVDEGIPLTIGRDVTIGHRCVVHGCTIEDQCLIGMGAVVMNNAVIGTGSVIAAGAVVLENTVVPPYSLVAGTPGKIKKSIEGDESFQKSLVEMTGIYIQNGKDFGSPDLFYEIKD
ncbi:MAG: gamma carbonic anhydrase family protein [Desulfobacter sp.]